MNAYKSEFFPRPKYDEHQRSFLKRLAYEFACLACILIILALIPACATTKDETESKVCAMKLVGRTGDGVPVVELQCITPEQFAEFNK